MTKRFVVVDQNILRKPILETLLFDDPDLRIILPDMAFLEMTKTAQWESTLKNSLATLAKYPRRVHICLSVNEALATELHALRPINARMMFPSASTFVRDLLHGFQSGQSSAAFERIKQNPDRHLDVLIQQHLNHEENKERLSGLIESTATMLPDEAKKRLRSKKVSDEERLQILHEIGKMLLPDVLATRGIDRSSAVAFMKKRPMVLRYLFLKAWRVLRWLGDGGFDDRSPQAITNDELDDQYILAASFYDGLLSEERAANEAYRDIRRLIAREV
jgi:hypothetical protein